MAMPRKGSRSLVVDGFRYRWRVTFDPWFWWDRSASGYPAPVRIVIESVDAPGPCLIATFEGGLSHALEALRRPFTPGLVRTLILAGLAKGWQPTGPGSQPSRLERDEVVAAVAAQTTEPFV